MPPCIPYAINPSIIISPSSACPPFIHTSLQPVLLACVLHFPYTCLFLLAFLAAFLPPSSFLFALTSFIPRSSPSILHGFPPPIFEPIPLSMFHLQCSSFLMSSEPKVAAERGHASCYAQGHPIYHATPCDKHFRSCTWVPV